MSVATVDVHNPDNDLLCCTNVRPEGRVHTPEKTYQVILVRSDKVNPQKVRAHPLITIYKVQEVDWELPRKKQQL